MSVAQTAERMSKQAGNDVTLSFSGSWKIFAATDLKVYKINAAGVYSALLTNGVDYTVTFDTDAETWTVTYTVAPVSSGYAVILGSNMPMTQAASFPREGVTPASTNKNAVDKLTVLVQQLYDILRRVPAQPATPVSPAAVVMDPPEDRRAAVYEEQDDGSYKLVPSEYDPDTLYNQSALLAPSYAEGTIALRPAAPSVRTAYYATDTGELAVYIPTAGRWFPWG